METWKRNNAQNCLKFFIYLYVKLNDPNYVLIKATIENLK